MSNEAETEAPKTKRRGRPPGTKSAGKTRPRHELTEAPVDGDYETLAIVNKDPAFHYVAMSVRDRQRRGHRYEPERWSEVCAHSPWEVFREEMRGQEVKVNGELVLMKIPTERDEAFKRRELNTFRLARDGISAADTDRGHKPQKEKRMVTHNIPVQRVYE
jgi:hypothetical protein